jgi:hypothetical protein
MGLLAKPSQEEEVVLLDPSSSGSKLSSFKSTKKPQNEIPGIMRQQQIGINPIRLLI